MYRDVNNFSKQNAVLYIVISCSSIYLPFFTHATHPNKQPFMPDNKIGKPPTVVCNFTPNSKKVQFESTLQVSTMYNKVQFKESTLQLQLEISHKFHNYSL